MDMDKELEDIKYFKKKMLESLKIPSSEIMPTVPRIELLRDAGIFVIEDEKWWGRSNSWQSSSALARVNIRRQMLYIEKLKKAMEIKPL